MGSRLKVLDVVIVPGRDDLLVVVDLLSGTEDLEGREFVLLKSNAVWRVTSIATHPAPGGHSVSTSSIALGLQPLGAPTLEVGDFLEAV